MIFPWMPFLKEGEDVGIANFYLVPLFEGAGQSPITGGGGVGIEVKDGDTVKLLTHRTAITEGTVRSAHEQDNSTSYQNTSGQDAIAILLLETFSAGTEERHYKIYSGPTDNSTASATLLLEYGSDATSGHFDAPNQGDLMTTSPLTISNNHYIIIENVDDSRAGTNDLVLRPGNYSIVVERA